VSLAGTRPISPVMHTDILSGPCQGWIEMDMTAERV
jgi:hypothetical protein